MDEMTLTLNNPLTEEDWEFIEDADFDKTNSIEFHTKHGKTVKFVKCTDEKTGDLISRQAAITEFNCCELTPDGGIDANDAIDILERLPSAQPERKPGKWILMSDADGEYYACSVCGNELQRYSTELPTWEKPYPHKQSIDKTDFCPNCGADMRLRGKTE